MLICISEEGTLFSSDKFCSKWPNEEIWKGKEWMLLALISFSAFQNQKIITKRSRSPPVLIQKTLPVQDLTERERSVVLSQDETENVNNELKNSACNKILLSGLHLAWHHYFKELPYEAPWICHDFDNEDSFLQQGPQFRSFFQVQQQKPTPTRLQLCV